MTTIRYCPRANWSPRMVGGQFQGANTADFSDAVTLSTVGYAPPEGTFTTVAINNTNAYRYLRYLSPADGSCNVAEIQFYTTPVEPPSLTALQDGANLVLSWEGDGRLLEATNLAGPWATNLSAASPFAVAPAEPRKFFRILAQ